VCTGGEGEVTRVPVALNSHQNVRVAVDELKHLFMVEGSGLRAQG